MKLQNKFFLFLSIGSAAVFLSGCSRSSDSETELLTDSSAIVDYTCITNPQSQEKIYVVLKNYHGNYWEKVIEGISSASEDLNAAIYLGGIDNETDISGQITLLEQAVEEGADGILLAPANSTALIDSCKAVKDAQLPLVLIDSSINSDDYDRCYMTDNVDAGEMAAQAMLTLLQDAGHSAADSLEVGILLSSDTSQAMVNRVSGFLDYWSNYAPEQWVIAEDIYRNGGDLQKAQSDATRLLEQHDQLKGIYGCNNTSTVGIVNTLLQKERTDIAMVGFDLAEETQQFLQNPNCYGVSLLQKQDQMGYLGILSLDALIHGEASEQKFFDTGVVVTDKNYLMENDVS